VKKYNVTVKRSYNYEEVPANSEEEAVNKVLNADWPEYDENDGALSAEAEEITED